VPSELSSEKEVVPPSTKEHCKILISVKVFGEKNETLMGKKPFVLSD
jgi:hypothetical protein